MNEDLKTQIIAALEKWMLANPRVTQNDLSKAVEVNAGYLINMRKGIFTVRSGDNDVKLSDKYFLRLAKFIGFEVSANHWNTKPTIQLKGVITHLTLAKENKDVSVIIGETGCGKTFSLDAFKSKYATEVFTIKVGATDNMKDLILKVCTAVGVVRPMATTSGRIGQIALRLRILNEEGRHPILVFDEAEYMKYLALCAFKELYDILHKECALVLIGTNELLKNIDKMIRMNKAGIPQLFRRIKFKIQHLPAIDREFKQFLTDVEPELKRWLMINCNNYGELHDVLVPSITEAEKRGVPVTLSLVKIVLGIAA